MEKLLSLAVAVLVLLSLPLRAEPGCVDSNVISGKLITDICWDCVFPIRLAGVAMSSKTSSIPTGATVTPLCLCFDDLGVPKPGVTTSMWKPARLIEFQRIPGCSSVLNGARLPFNRTFQGTHRTGGKAGEQRTFMHYHYYAFPLLTMLGMFTNPTCNHDEFLDLDLMYMSELDPTWNNDELAFFTNPEAAAIANPVAILACSADAVAATAGHPINSMFWCAGSWGGVYPLSGHQYTDAGVLQNTSLLTVKVLAALHRRGLAHKTIGEDAICEGKIDPTLDKDMYKYTLLYPLPETAKAHVTGESILKWGIGRTIPAIGEDLIYTIWRYEDCCNTKY
jgi:conjugal transfer pilus assembly protein TraU